MIVIAELFVSLCERQGDNVLLDSMTTRTFSASRRLPTSVLEHDVANLILFV